MNWHDARPADQAHKFIALPWRVGGSVGRTIYVKEGRSDPADSLIGLVDSSELADHIVALHNAHLDGDGCA